MLALNIKAVSDLFNVSINIVSFGEGLPFNVSN